MQKSKVKINMDNLKLVQETTEELLKQLLITGTVGVEEKDENFHVQIETEESGILIGFHGETLASFQLILSLILYKKLGIWVKILVNVGDYRQKKEESLKQMILGLAERVAQTGESIPIPDLSSFERRIVHLTLADNPKVITISEGEGRDRQLVIKLKE